MSSEQRKTALLVIDMINAYDFDDAEKLLASARETVPSIASLVKRARDEDVEVIYSALDAYIRHLDVVVPTDAVAHIHEDLAQAALRMMEINMKAELCLAEDCRLTAR